MLLYIFPFISFLRLSVFFLISPFRDVLSHSRFMHFFFLSYHPTYNVNVQTILSVFYLFNTFYSVFCLIIDGLLCSCFLYVSFQFYYFWSYSLFILTVSFQTLLILYSIMVQGWLLYVHYSWCNSYSLWHSLFYVVCVLKILRIFPIIWFISSSVHQLFYIIDPTFLIVHFTFYHIFRLILVNSIASKLLSSLLIFIYRFFSLEFSIYPLLCQRPNEIPNSIQLIRLSPVVFIS